jgi:hypothetical protein
MWREEVHMQLLAKGFLLIKDAKLLEPAAYSDFISVLVALKEEDVNTIVYTLPLCFFF